jgi:hypothetical protein
VSNGLFAVRLDFGSGIFTGEARWLQTAVRCPAGSGTYTTLAPRQMLAPVPYAMFSQDFGLPFGKWTDSALNAFSVGNHGTGPAGDFSVDDPANDNAALRAATHGTGAALGAWAWGSADAIWANTHGTGDVASFQIDNPSNTGNLINASTNGLGNGASFRISNTLSNKSALSASTDGSGAAGSFNAWGSASAVSAWAFGSGRALNAEVRGTGGVAFLKIDNPNNTDALVNAETNGLGGGAGFRINNTLNTAPALDAYTNGSGSAGMFRASGSGRGVVISVPAGNEGLNVVSGSKSAVVGTSSGARLLYTEESSAVWFADYGFGHLADGRVFVTIEPLFAETVNLDEPYHVFVQAYGDAELYVSQRTPLGFEVRLCAGDPNVEFSYRLVATRRGYEDKRLEHAAWADNDPNLYPTPPAAPQNGGAR